MPESSDIERELRLRELRSAEGDALDEALCAWLDGELAADEVAVLEERAGREARVRQRRDELSRVDAALAAIPLPPVDATLRARLQQRIDAAAPSAASGGRRTAGRPRGALRARRWLPAAAAAVAAGLVAYLVLVRPAPRPPPGSGDAGAARQMAGGTSDAPQATARAGESDSGVGGTGAAPAPREALAARRAPPLPAPRTPEAGAEALAPAPQALAAGTPTPLPELPSAPTPDALAARGDALPSDALVPEEVGDGELAIAFDLDVLRDFEVIDQLELLERLAELELETPAGDAPAAERG